MITQMLIKVKDGVCVSFTSRQQNLFVRQIGSVVGVGMEFRLFPEFISQNPCLPRDYSKTEVRACETIGKRL